MRKFAARVAGIVAAVIGRVVGAVHVKPVLGVAGAAVVAYGAAEIYRPAGVIAAGLFLLLAAREA